MKKILSLLLAAVCLLSLCACQQEDPNSRTVYIIEKSSTDYTDGNMLIVEYTYDPDDNPLKSVHTYNFGGYVSSVTYTHDYNDFGQTTEHTDVTSKTVYNYDSKGLLISSLIYYDEQIDAAQQFHYENDQLVKSEWIAGGTVFSYSTYEYNKNNRVSKVNTYDGQGTLASYAEYKYSSNGKSCTVKCYNADGSLYYTQTITYKAIKVPLESPRRE